MGEQCRLTERRVAGRARSHPRMTPLRVRIQTRSASDQMSAARGRARVAMIGTAELLGDVVSRSRSRRVWGWKGRRWRRREFRRSTAPALVSHREAFTTHDAGDAPPRCARPRSPSAHSSSSMRTIVATSARLRKRAGPVFFRSTAMPCFSISAMKSDGCVPCQRRACEVRIGGDSSDRAAAWMLVKLQRPPPEIRIFAPALVIVFEHQYAPPASACMHARNRAPPRRAPMMMASK